MPEQTQNAPSGVTEFSPTSPQTTTEDVALMQRVFQAAAQNPLMIPTDLMAYIIDYVQTSRLIIPIGQVFGFAQFTANVATTIAASESTTSSSYTDLATTGPELTGLPAGKYVLLFGCAASAGTSGAEAVMSVSVNGGAASDADNLGSAVTANQHSVMRAVAKVLSAAGGNSITAQYRSTGGTATFQNRWLIALKYSN